MKKKNLYQLVKQSLKEVLQEQRFLRGRNIEDALKLTGISREKFIDILERIFRANRTNLKPQDILAQLEKLTAPQIAQFLLKPSGKFNFIDIINIPDDPLPGEVIIGADGEPECNGSTDYGTITLYINDPNNNLGNAVGVGGAQGTEGCQTIEIDDSYMCCGANNSSASPHLFAAGAGDTGFDHFDFSYFNGTTSNWFNYSADSVSCYYSTDENGNFDPNGMVVSYDTFLAFHSNNLTLTFGNLNYPDIYLSDYCGLPGCTDTAAFNFNQDANNDNGTCQFEGCTDASADNTGLTVTPTLPTYANAVVSTNFNDYSDQNAQNDALCIYTIEGCTDPTAINFNPDATNDDGSCVFEAEEVPGCTDPEAINYDVDATADNGTCVFVGCTDASANNVNTLGVTPTVAAYSTGATAGYDADNYPDGENTQNEVYCTYTVYGCPESTATNTYVYTSPQTPLNTTVIDQVSATDTTSPCEYALVEGCGNDLADNYNPNADVNNPLLCEFNTYCTDPQYDNYICVVAPQLCYDPTQQNVACGNTPCPDGIFGGPGGADIGTLIPNIDACESENTFCPDPLATNGPTEDISEQTVTQIEDLSTCIYEFCNDDTTPAYNYTGLRPDGNPWNIGGTNPDIPNNNLCEYVGCANNEYEGYIPQFEGGLSTEFPSPLSTITVYYYNEGNSGCEDDPDASIDPNGIQPTGNLNPANTDCCPGDDDARFGCTDDGNLGQQYWSLTQAQGANYPVPYSNRTDISDLVTSHTAISNYPGVSANNYDVNNMFDDGSCKYNIGCMDPESVTYNPDAQIDDSRLCKYCKDIVAVQCNPDPDPNGYAQDYIDDFGSLEEQIDIDSLNKFKEPRPPKPLKSNFTHTITRACVTIGGQKPEVGDEFLAQGIQYTSAGSGVVGGGNQILQVNEVEDVELGPDTVWDPLDDDPTLTYCCCPDPYPNTYINAEAPGATCGNACGGYPAPPEGCPDDDGPSGLPDLTVYDSGKPGKINLQAVFRVTQIMNPSTTVLVDLSPWQCNKRPPGGGLGIGIGNVGVEFPADKIKIKEVEISKKLRKSLTEMFKKKK